MVVSYFYIRIYSQVNVITFGKVMTWKIFIPYLKKLKQSVLSKVKIFASEVNIYL